MARSDGERRVCAKMVPPLRGSAVFPMSSRAHSLHCRPGTCFTLSSVLVVLHSLRSSRAEGMWESRCLRFPHFLRSFFAARVLHSAGAPSAADGYQSAPAECSRSTPRNDVHRPAADPIRSPVSTSLKNTLTCFHESARCSPPAAPTARCRTPAPALAPETPAATARTRRSASASPAPRAAAARCTL